MLTLLIKLLGIHLDRAAALTHVRLLFRGGMSPGMAIALAIVLAAAVAWMYHISARQLSWMRRWGMAVLRTLLLVMLIFMLTRPVLQLTLEGSVRRTLLMLIDCTKSMVIPEDRSDPNDQKRAGIALGQLDPEKGLNQSLPSNAADTMEHVARLDLIKSVLKNTRLNLLPRMAPDLDARAFRFGQGKPTDELVREAGRATEADSNGKTSVHLDWVDSLVADGTTTPLGDSIRDVLAKTRGQPLAGMWLITDGQSNTGSSVLNAARQAREDGVPLYIYGVGITTPKDIIVEKPFAPDIAFVNDEVPMTVRVRSQGLAGRTARLALNVAGEEADHADLQLGDDDEQVVTVKYTPTRPGDYDLTANVPPLSDEAVTTNNTQTHHLRVIDGKIKVLYIEQSPRWEFKYLQAMLARDRRVSLNCVLVEGDPGIADAPGSPFLKAIPSTREELLKYDLIILGDVDVRVFTTDQIKAMDDFVSQFGGGLLSIAGRRFNPWSYNGTPIEKMLPVDVEANPVSRGADVAGETPIKLELTDTGQRNPILRLSESDMDNERLWQGGLPPIFWDARVSRAKPAAEVLLDDPDKAKESKYGKMPVIAIQQYGVGQVLYVGTDNLWRWRKNRGEKYYVAFWGQAVQRLALPHLLGGSKRVQLRADKDSYSAGERVTIDARLYDKSFAPVTDKEITGYFVADTGERTPVLLRPVPDQPGNYRAQFVAPGSGHYQFWIDRADDPDTQKTKLDVTVTEPRLETEETAMNEADLRAAAAASGGQFFREEDLAKLPDAVKQKTESVQSTAEVEIWSSPLYFLLMIAIVTAEWIVRKTSHLK